MRKYSPCRQGSLALLALLILLSGCDQSPQTTAPEPTATLATAEDAQTQQALAKATLAAWQQAAPLLTQSLDSVGQLQAKIATLLQTPDASTLAASREAWHLAHDQYQLLQPFLQLGQIKPGLFGPLREHQFNIDAWPIQPGYLDAFDVYSHSGIVNDIALPMTATAMRQQHGFSDATDVSLGFHAMAYLLWGETGQRPPGDFVATGASDNGLSAVEQPNNRRRSLLQLQVQLLTDDLNKLRQQLLDPVSPLQVNYTSLMPASRLQLWQQLAYHSLSRYTQTAEPVTEHNQFAGQAARPLAAELNAWETLLVSGDTPLAGFWLQAEQQEQLQASLQSARSQLEQWDTKKASNPLQDENLQAALATATDYLKPAHLTQQAAR